MRGPEEKGAMATSRVRGRKIILVLLDGAGDRSYAELGHQTPLEAAHTPHLDRLAWSGGNGLYHAGRVGTCFPSENAHYLMWGYEGASFPGRGLLEAAGYGLSFQDEDVLLLAHLSTAYWQSTIPFLAHSRKALVRDGTDLSPFYQALKPLKIDGYGFRLHPCGPNDAILVIQGGASPHVSDVDPMVPGQPFAKAVPLSESPEPEKALRTAQALNGYLSHCHLLLKNHPLNLARAEKGLPTVDFLVTQRAGRRILQKPFEELWGMKGRLIATGAVYAGLAKELGMTFTPVRDTADPGKDLKERLSMALEDDVHDFIHVHTKVPDEAGHRGDPRGKAEALGALDRAFEGWHRRVEQEDGPVMAVTADHSTPCGSVLIHSGETVPLLMAGPTVRRDRVFRFNELDAAKGCLGLLRGKELLLSLLNAAERSSLFGHRLGSLQTPHFPDNYEPFEV